MKSQLILLGAPGSGKGTQASRFVNELGYEHISTGDLLRKEIKSNSALGRKVQGIMNSGNLVDDHTVLELLNSNCDLKNKAYIFDGFPRNHEQAKLLDEEVLGSVKSKAIYFEIDLDALASRLVNRRTCADCGQIYNLVSRPPKVEGKCDSCGSENLTQRKDDNEETVKTRLKVFSDAIGPVLDFYENRGRLVRVDASKGPDAVFSVIKDIIE